MKAKHLIHSAASLLPVGYPALLSLKNRIKPRKADSAAYCYAVWLQHLHQARKNGLNDRPEVVLEFGPGGSLGVGLAALISGADKYIGVDVAGRHEAKKNLAIFDELVGMFQRRDPFPEGLAVKPFCQPRDIPSCLLDEGRMRDALAPGRVERIRDLVSIITGGGEDKPLVFFSPWQNADLPEGVVDMVVSTKTMEHVDDLHAAYGAAARWLKPGGFMSHLIDFDSHGCAEEWNGHWGCSDFKWKLLRGRRPYLINREPLSAHLDLMSLHGFGIQHLETERRAPELPREKFAPKFIGMSEDDATARMTFAQALRSAPPGGECARKP